MSINDAATTTTRLGFRVDGIARAPAPLVKSDVNALKDAEEIAMCVAMCFLPGQVTPSEEQLLASAALSETSHAGADPEKAFCEKEEAFKVTKATLHKQMSAIKYHPPEEAVNLRQKVAKRILERLVKLRHAVETSSFMRRHELIGTSLLFVGDADGEADVFLIDFAKTSEVPDGVEIDHRKQWELGNHEDGILLGIDSCIKVFEKAIEIVSGERALDVLGDVEAWRATAGVRRPKLMY